MLIVIPTDEFISSKFARKQETYAVLMPGITLCRVVASNPRLYQKFLCQHRFEVSAVGLDDTLVIVNTLRQSAGKYQRLDVRLGLAMEAAGVPVTFTTLTSLTAFCGGLFSDTPAVRLFALYSIAAFAFNYIFLLTFFLGSIAGLAGSRCKSICRPS